MFKFKIGDNVHVVARYLNGLRGKGVVSKVVAHDHQTKSAYQYVYRIAGINYDTWFREDELVLFKEPNDIMKDLL